MTYFLEDVSRFLFNLNGGNFKDTIVVFPNRRARLFFNKYLSEFSEKPLWAPGYYAISEFLQQLSEVQLADQLSLVFRLFHVYKKVTGSNETFDTFYFYCEMILADFNDIDKNLIDAGKLYQNLSDLKSIDNYYDYLSESQLLEIKRFWEIYISSRNSEDKKQFTVIWDALKSIYLEFNKLLDDEGMGYEGKVYRNIVEQIQKGKLQIPENKQIVFVGFNALNRAEEILFEHLKKTGKALFFWDYNESYINSDIHEAGFFLRKYLPRFPPPQGFKSGTSAEKPNTILKSVAVPSNIAQAKVIDMFFNETGDENISDPGQTAVILTDESLLLPVINSLPSLIGSVNISMGYPVADTPAFSFISILSDVQKNCRFDLKNQQFLVYHKDFFGILNHIYFEPVSNTKEYTGFIKTTKEKNQVYINPLSFVTDDILYAKVFSKPDSPKAFGNYLVEILKIVASDLIKKGSEKVEVQWHLEVIYSIFKVLLRFDSLLTESGIDFTFPTVLKLLKEILNGISVPFSGEPLTGMQLIGILETRTLNFKNLIFLSMNEGKFPKTGHAPSMIPYSLREGFGLPTINHQDAIYAYYFYRLVHRAEKVILIHNTKSEGLQKGEQSRFLLQLKYDPKYKMADIDLGYKVTSSSAYRITGKKDEESLLKLERYLRPDGDGLLSPSGLNIYLNCKLRFYFKYIEGMKEPETIEEDIESNVFGSILHKTIKLLYEGFEGKNLEKESITQIRKNRILIRKSVDKAFAEEYLHKNEIEEGDLRGRNLIIRKVIEKYVDGILKYDILSAPIHIISLEKKYMLELLIPKLNRRIAFGGYIDRLDKQDGVIRVIDYKTGQVKDKFDTIDALFDATPSTRNIAVFQTFLYSLIVQHDFNSVRIVPSLYYVRNIHQKDFNYKIKYGKEEVEDFGKFHQYFEERIIKLIEELYNPEIEFTQTGDLKYCMKCPYNAICMRKG